MNFEYIITDFKGLVHLIFSIIALISGSLVLGLKKGTKTHKRIGTIYAMAMIILLATAFTMYNLFGRWGIFHWAAVVSTITLGFGLIPILTKRPKKNYMSMHFSFMYWSVIGLYGAFLAEFCVRFPKNIFEAGITNEFFYNMTGIAVAITMGIGAYFFIKRISKWNRDFNPKE